MVATRFDYVRRGRPGPSPTAPRRALSRRRRRPPARAWAILGLLICGAPLQATPGMAAPAGDYGLVGRWPDATAQSPPGTFVDPTGLDISPAGVLAVADTGNARVQLFAADGRFLVAMGQFGAREGETVAPRDVALANARVYATDPPSGRVVVWSEDGTPVATAPGFGEPWGIAATRDGRLLVTDRDRGEIVVLAADGQRLAAWGRPGGRGGELDHPEGIAVAPNGEVFVADRGNSRIQVLSALGRFRDDFLLPEPGGGIADLAVDGRDNVFVLAGERVLWLDRDSANRVTLVTALDLEHGAGVALGPAYGLFVARASSAAGVGEVNRLPLVRGAPPDLVLGAFGGAMGRLVDPRRLAAGPGDEVLVLAPRSLGRYGADGAFLGLRSMAADDAVTLPGGELVTVTGTEVSRWDGAGLRRWTWPPPGSDPTGGMATPELRYSWLAHVAYDPMADQICVLDAGTGTVLRLTPDGQLADMLPVASGASFTAYGDLDVMPDGTLALTNPAFGQIELRSRDGALRRAMPLPAAPLRLDAAGNRLFVLTEDGWLWRFGLDLKLEAAWDATAGGRLVDVMAASDDAWVLDTAHNQVLRWAWDEERLPQPPPRLPEELRCAVTVAARANPEVLLRGETTSVTLTVSGTCPSTVLDTDILLVTDESGSMKGEKLAAAKAAAHAFLNSVDFSRTQVGLVAFSHEAALAQPLTADSSLLRAAVDAMAAVGGTDIAAGLRLAHGELDGPRHRPAARRAMVLLTDGNSEVGDAVRSALEAKLHGAWLLVIGLGDDVNGELLRHLATSPADYYEAPAAEQLDQIYSDIGRRIRADGLARTLAIRETLPPELEFDGAVAGPAPSQQGQSLVWSLSAVGFEGVALQYRVRPRQVGQQPAVGQAEADFIDGFGRGGRAIFPVPWIAVLEPRHLPTPTPSATPLPPQPVFLPLLAKGHCLLTEQHADVMLVLDASHSMLDADDGGRTKLEAAVAAASTFVGLLRLPVDQVGLVVFHSQATIAAPLAADAATVRAALASVTAAPGTRLDLGLEAARGQLAGPARRPWNVPVVVLLTDGRPSGASPEQVVAVAERLRAPGTVVFAIGLGQDVDPDLLGRVTADAGRVYLAPDGDDLEGIYRLVAGAIPCH